MSAKGLRNFTVHNRPEETEKLVRRLKDGLGSNKYRNVDYEQLKAYTAEKKLAGNQKLMKVKQLQEVSKQGKEQHLLKQHRMVWQKEFLRLNANRRKLQAEVEFHVRLNSDSEIADHIYQEFEDYESKLGRDFTSFKKATVDPMWTLRDDLQYWVTQHKGSLDHGVQEEGEQILETVDNVKQQQEGILSRLANEQERLEYELQSGELGDLFVTSDRRLPQTGIPAEAFDLDCPDSSLKASVLQEFILLDERYLDRLGNLEADHSYALSSENGGWTEDDHYLFQLIVDQYPHDMQNRRMLYIDRLRRHMPKKTRSQIVEHEEWWIHFRFYHERRRDLITDWTRDRRELLNRCKVVLAEACVAHDLEAAKQEHRHNQQEICDHLYQKVQQWREQKTEAMRLQQELEARRQEERLRSMRADEERNKKKRDAEKEKVRQFHEDKTESQRLKMEADRVRLEELKAQLAEQAEHDWQRVRFREEQFQLKQEQKAEREKKLLEEEEEKEKRLEALREQVRPHVEEDLRRLWSDTKAWEAHLKPEEDDLQLQRPLFAVNTFTANQITADPRVRLENQLRQAGLINNDYARSMLTQMKPLQPPRRDMESTVFKNT